MSDFLLTFIIILLSSYLLSHDLTFNQDLCQASGFLVSLAFEGTGMYHLSSQYRQILTLYTDFAILFIALHAVLHIFKPVEKTRQGGLYAYRHVIYVLWVFIPILLSSIVFANPAGGYSEIGQLCYINGRPLLYRLILSWVPRYIILGTIVIAYIAIYVHVRRKFREIEKAIGAPYDLTAEYDTSSTKNLTSNTQMGQSYHQQSGPSIRSEDGKQSGVSNWDATDYVATPANARAPMDRGRAANLPRLSVPASGTQTNEERRFTGARVTTQITPGHAVPQHLANRNASLAQAQLRIKKQLRFLFIYPIIYVAVWTFPFVSEIMEFTPMHDAQPYWLGVLIVTAWSGQSGANALAVMYREKPWKRTKDLGLGVVPTVIPTSTPSFLNKLFGRKANTSNKLGSNVDIEKSTPHRAQFNQTPTTNKGGAIELYDNDVDHHDSSNESEDYELTSPAEWKPATGIKKETIITQTTEFAPGQVTPETQSPASTSSAGHGLPQEQQQQQQQQGTEGQGEHRRKKTRDDEMEGRPPRTRPADHRGVNGKSFWWENWEREHKGSDDDDDDSPI